MRVLSPDEEIRYLTAAARETTDLADVAMIMLLQGPRPDEVMSLEQARIDLRNRHFTIWDNSAEGKSSNAHQKLKMTDETFRIFQRRVSVPGVWVFPSSRNDGPTHDYSESTSACRSGKDNRERQIRRRLRD